ncbi:ABC transporter substrate-binding protein [Pseudoalteromonas rubra]|uniref:ABC transporter substrate-binding protein n=1 Tax=Pseudoalteromonas rubra TaxID=43658 RepID=A0A4Q7EBC5_9GAMM|nr:phosphate ABC transporter substrate-binding protein [Pseudoalteromonas rubra]RZM78457.1 ABC transporter substrate-binding protein [Pseudoalteromonas rubra]
MNIRNSIFYLTLILSTNSVYANDKQKLLITGSSTVSPVVQEIARVYEQQQKKVLVDVQTGGSSKGVMDSRSGLSDIGMVSRALKQSEQDLKAYTLGFDGISLITHSSNSLSNLTKKQVIDIYTGKINNWKVLGGPDEEIVVISKAAGRSTLELFLAYLGIKHSKIKADIVIGDNEQGIKAVESNKFAIGYVSIGAAKYRAENGAPIKLISADGHIPSLENVRKRTYPMTRELNLVTYGNVKDSTNEFIKFSLQQSSLIEAFNFVPAE